MCSGSVCPAIEATYMGKIICQVRSSICHCMLEERVFDCPIRVEDHTGRTRSPKRAPPWAHWGLRYGFRHYFCTISMSDLPFRVLVGANEASTALLLDLRPQLLQLRRRLWLILQWLLEVSPCFDESSSSQKFLPEELWQNTVQSDLSCPTWSWVW